MDDRKVAVVVITMLVVLCGRGGVEGGGGGGGGVEIETGTGAGVGPANVCTGGRGRVNGLVCVYGRNYINPDY